MDIMIFRRPCIISEQIVVKFYFYNWDKPIPGKYMKQIRPTCNKQYRQIIMKYTSIIMHCFIVC